jgi:UDP-N-acetyl-D-mannosaminuronate dehydrogenase
MFAKHGVDVLGVDIKQEAVDMLNGGTIHIEEPGLQEALEEVLETGKFRASTTAKKQMHILLRFLHQTIMMNINQQISLL